MHRNVLIGTGRPLVPPIQRRIFEIGTTLVYLTEQIGQECTDATSIRLPSRSTENQEKNAQNQFHFNSTKGGTRLLPVLHGELGHVQKLVELMRIIEFFEYVAASFV